MKLRVIFVVGLLIALVAPLSAQRVYRTEFTPYDTREDALRASHAETENYMPYKPRPVQVLGKVEIVGSEVEIPTAWCDYNVYLHLENTIKAYDLVVNGNLVASVEESYTPADFLISPFITQGKNDVALFLRRSEYPELSDGAHANLVEQFSGSCIFAQHRVHVFDYDGSIALAENGKNLLLELDVQVRNDFNFEEQVKVGYDIYDPEGRLIDYAVRDFAVAGRSVDTLRIRTNLGAEARFRWSAAKPQLYRLTLYVKRDGKPREYILFHLGGGTTTFADGRILRDGQPLVLRTAAYDARTTRDRVTGEIRALKKQGINTLLPSCPQPEWFYDVCDRVGMYVVERANITPVKESDNRAVGGTPSNNPLLLDEYLARVKAMYYRTRNHPCVIAYALGGEQSGNGFNMYRAYQWLKGVEKRRAVICPGADGEWNTDIDSLK